MLKTLLTAATIISFAGVSVSAMAADGKAKPGISGQKLGKIATKRSGAATRDTNNAMDGSIIAPILAAGVVVGGIVAVANDDNGGKDDSAS
jgi:hypothetical protein